MLEKFKTDDVLWQQFKEGSQDAFYRLYDQFADSLFRYGSHYSRDKEFIKDCIHDLFLDLYKYRKKLSGTDNVQFYLFRSLRRIIHKEQVKLIPFVLHEMIGSPNNNTDQSNEDYIIATETETENSMLLKMALSKLSKRQRIGLSLKFEHDLSYPEIAEILGISVESSRTIIYRALKELRKSMEHKSPMFQLLFLLFRCGEA